MGRSEEEVVDGVELPFPNDQLIVDSNKARATAGGFSRRVAANRTVLVYALWLGIG